MEENQVKRWFECSILVVDDEKAIRDFLCESLEKTYMVTCVGSAEEAIELVAANNFDIVITDLVLPGKSGIDVVRATKSRDEYTEVIVLTGFGSLESATQSINLGVASYLIKPIVLSEFLSQVQRAAASRVFHLKSIQLMDQSSNLSPNERSHISDITGLYHFSRKLMLTLETNEILKIILEEINHKLDAYLCAVAVDFLDFSEIFAMPGKGKLDDGTVRELLLDQWEVACPQIHRDQFKSGAIPLMLYSGKKGETVAPEKPPRVFSLPMTVMGRTIGTLIIFRDTLQQILPDEHEYLHVFTSIISSIVEHGYMDLQSRLQAKTDSLTGIANHRMFNEILTREISRVDRNKNEFALVLIDIDDFKKVNDTYGHLVGDAVIKDLTVRVNEVIRRGDVLSRYGGEEFALVLPDTDVTGAQFLAGRICRELTTNPFKFGQVEIWYTVSLGIAIYSGATPKNREQLFTESDSALYRSKKDGKNRFTVFG